MRLSSYTRDYDDRSYSFYQWAGGLSWIYAVTNINTIRWSLAQGGSDDCDQIIISDWSDGSVWRAHYLVSNLWPPAPDLGVQTVSYVLTGPPGFDWSSYDYTNIWADFPQPDYPWEHVAVSSHEAYTGNPNDPSFQYLTQITTGETNQAYVELLTGGAPGSAEPVSIVLIVSAQNTITGLPIHPTLIQIRGQNADVNGLVRLSTTNNLVLDVTPTLPAAYSNYTFIVATNGPTVLSVTTDKDVIAVGDPVTFTAITSPPGAIFVFDWYLDGVLAASSTGNTFTCALPYAGFPTVTAQSGPSQASTNVTVCSVVSITGDPPSAAVGDGTVFNFTAWLYPAVTNPPPLIWLVDGVPDLTSTGTNFSTTFNIAGPHVVTVFCGTSMTWALIPICAATSVSASSPVVAVGDGTVTFTATLDPPVLNPPPLTWFVDGVVDGSSTNLTFTAGFTSTGTHSVSVVCGTSAAATNVVAVGVKRLEYQFQDGWLPVPNPFYVFLERTVTFRAIPEPENAPAWPTGMPVWSGTAAVSGPPGTTTTVTFNTQSATATDFQTVIATCGTSSVTANVTTVKVKLVAVDTDLANDAPDMGLDVAQRANRSMATLYAQVTPPVPGLPLSVQIISSNPETTDKGQFVFGAGLGPPPLPGGRLDSYAGDKYYCWYLAKKELKDNEYRDRTSVFLTPQTVTIKLSWDGLQVDSAVVNITGHFKWLLKKTKYQEAVDFVNSKYDVGVASPTYVLTTQSIDPNIVDGEALTTTYLGSVYVSKKALDAGENWTASTLFHELVHVQQGVINRQVSGTGGTYWVRSGGNTNSIWINTLTKPFILAYATSEIDAYNGELSVAMSNVLNDDEIRDIQINIREYTDIIILIYSLFP